MRNFVYAAVVFGSGQRFSKVNYSGPSLEVWISKSSRPAFRVISDGL